VVNESGYHTPAILYYSGRNMPDFEFSDLGKLLADHPDALIITKPKTSNSMA
jgi:hypothetical protein